MLQDDVAQSIRVDAVRYRSAQAGVQACRPSMRTCGAITKDFFQAKTGN